ncbi:MAG TPA: alpha/beta hydrolase [Candidatus Elarobacter sp.]|jgi:acetyl esterase
MLDPLVRDFLAQVEASNRPPIWSIPLADARALFEETFARLGGPPADVAQVIDVEADGPRGPIPVRVYTPHGSAAPLPLFVYYHGGGYVCGSRDSYDAVCRLLCVESGCIVASVDYRLAPEFPAPAPFEDAYAACVWLAAHASDFGADATRLAIGGDSAGGGLGANVALKARDANGPRIAHQLLVYPAVANDITSASYEAYSVGHFLTGERMAFYWDCYIPQPEIGELPYVLAVNAATLRGLPPATIVLAECDPLYSEGVAYYERLRADGVAAELRVYEGMIHAFWSFIAIFPQGRAAVTEAARTVGAVLGAGGGVSTR